jgi:hypothetical protein
MKTYKTHQGTELPLLNLRGRDYLEVKFRLVWFREEHPDWSIETEYVSTTEKSACARAVIRDASGRCVATSHKFENESGFPDFMEKAETGAIGRALALIGYGTQFCADELDEGSRIVDSPVAPHGSQGYAGASQEPSEASGAGPGLRRESYSVQELDEKASKNGGDFVVPFGRKYRGKKVSEIPKADIQSYLSWLEDEAEKKRVPLSFEAKVLKKAVEIYYAEDLAPTGSGS